MNGGYIFLYRELMEKPIFNDPWLLKIWVWCLFKANFAPGKIIKGNTVIELERGQFFFGRNNAAQELSSDQFKITPSALYRKIKLLEKFGSILLNANSFGTVITVVNYNVYQPLSDFGEQQVNSKRTASEHIIKRNKNNKKYNPLLSPLKKGSRKKKYDFAAYDRELFESMLNSDD